MRSILAIISLVGLITIALLFYSTTTSVDEMEQTASGYKQGVKDQLKAKTKEIAQPVLDKLGVNVDVEKVSTDDLNIVKQKLEEASKAVDDASKKIGAPQ